MARRILSWIFSLTAVAASAQGPDANWRTLSTPHFRVHFPAEYEAWTKLAASRLEAVRDAVVHEVGYAPETVTDVLVMNPVADSNGMTLPLLGSPRIVLFTEPPRPQSQIGEFSDWIDLLTVHETAHLVHLLRPSRNRTQQLLAHVLPLNPITLAAPRWVLEGYATVIEGRITGSGRPSSAFRAAILRKWAVNGRLPTYSQLDSDRGFLGLSMAYLVGSAYLEWLERRSGPDSLRHLWARMTARQRRGFDQSFAGVFGDSPERLYGRFTSELTERAVEAAKETREGDLWQETTRGSGEPAVSPDGSELAMVVRDADGDGKLVVFSTGPNPEEEKLAKRIERALKRDPEDVAPVRGKPLPRKPLHSLKLIDGGDVESPRWTRDGASIVYSHKQPDREGFLHYDLFLWNPESGRRRRLTHLADVRDADPLPDGRRAIAIRNRYGYSELVTVDLGSGGVRPFLFPFSTTCGEREKERPDPIVVERIVDHPRAAADGRIAWTEHDRSGWHVMVDGKPVAQSGAFSPEWGPHGELFAAIATNGFIEIARDFTPVTRSAGAALDPAPAPDGSVYFMSLEPEGFVVRRVSHVEPALSRLESPERRLYVFREEPLAPSRPYGLGRQELAWTFGGAWTAYGTSKEIGVRIGDVVGRLDAIAIASSGSDSADRGAALALAWRGSPVALTSHVFTLRDRRGAELRGELTHTAPLSFSRIEAGAMAGNGHRAFVDGSYALHARRTSGTARIAADSARHSRGSLRVGTRIGGIRVSAGAEAGRRMTIGGVASSVDPDSLLVNRVLDPALPIAFATASRYRGARGEVTLSGLTAFWQRHRVPHTLDVRGVEFVLRSRPVPLLRLPAFDLTAGAAHVTTVRGVKGWLALHWRP